MPPFGHNLNASLLAALFHLFVDPVLFFVVVNPARLLPPACIFQLVLAQTLRPQHHPLILPVLVITPID